MAEKIADLIKDLKAIYKNAAVQEEFQRAIDGVKKTLPDGRPNDWVGKDSDYFCDFFQDWYDFDPVPGGGLTKIVQFTNFSYENPAAFSFLNDEKPIRDWTKRFIKARGEYMDSFASIKNIDTWVRNEAIEISDFVPPARGKYASFNEFFTREIRPGARPIADVQDDSVVASPADAQMILLSSKLTVLPGKGIKVKESRSKELNAKKLLNNYRQAADFEDGYALACILFPASYHHFHAPVAGAVVKMEMVDGINLGLGDTPAWLQDGLRDSEMDFSIFEQYQRGYFIIATECYGKVAMVAVGLSTISGINFELSSVNVSDRLKGCSSRKPIRVEKGEELGYFKYGGSLIILLFEPGCYDGIKVLQGARIGKLQPPRTKKKATGKRTKKKATGKRTKKKATRTREKKAARRYK